MNKKLLPARLKELRTIHGHTQDYVASVLGIARQTYSHYETGKRTPSPDALFKLAGLYDISVDDLMQLTIEVDRDISYDAPAPSQTSIDLEGFIEYFSNTNNQKKFQFLVPWKKNSIIILTSYQMMIKKKLLNLLKLKFTDIKKAVLHQRLIK